MPSATQRELASEVGTPGEVFLASDEVGGLNLGTNLGNGDDDGDTIIVP